jgi:hypothetical protein
MTTRFRAVIAVLLVCLAAGLPAQTRTYPIDDLRPGMVATGRTVFEGDRLDEFKVHILGVLRNVIGPRRNLILARLEGGPLANTGVIAGMSGSPVYIDGRLVGAVSYSLGQFSKEPIAGITPFDEMLEAATLPASRRPAQRVELTTPITQEGLRAALSQAFAWTKPFADSPNDVQIFGDQASTGINGGIATLLRPIATPITLGGFDPSVIAPVASAFSDRGFVPVTAGGSMKLAAQQSVSASAPAPLRPGDPIGVALMSGDLELGATGTVTEVAGDRIYAFGHPFYGLGPTAFPLTRAHVHVVLPSLSSSMKIASTGEVIGTVLQDRATTIAGTLGAGPSLIPITLNLNAERGTKKTFKMAMVRDQLFTPLLAYLSVLNTLTSYERENGVASYAVHGSAQIKNHAPLAFEDLFSGDQPSVGAAASVVTPINVLLRNSFEDVEIDALTLDIQASEQARSATLERVWLDGARVKPGSTVNIKVLLRSYRGEEIMKSLPLQVPANARGSLSVMVSDGVRLSQWESRELQVQPLQTRGVPQLLQILNSARRNNRLYVRLVARDGGAIVKGESLAALPPSVLAVMEADRSGGSFRPLQSAVLGEWEIPTDLAVTGSRTLTLPLEE